MIAQSAIKHLSTNYVITGKRHNNCFEEFHRLFPKLKLSNEKGERLIIQGFVTDNAMFVNRREAAKIAFECGQTKTDMRQLFSEDIFK